MPSLRNSGLATTGRSDRPSISGTCRVVPTGTVDLTTTTVPDARTGPSSPQTASSTERSVEPSEPVGVGRVSRTWSMPTTASNSIVVNESCPLAMPSTTRSIRPSSTIGTSPAPSRSTLSASRSTHTTWWPMWARHAPAVRPTYPVPTTASFDTVGVSQSARRTRRRGAIGLSESDCLGRYPLGGAVTFGMQAPSSSAISMRSRFSQVT